MIKDWIKKLAIRFLERRGYSFINETCHTPYLICDRVEYDLKEIVAYQTVILDMIPLYHRDRVEKELDIALVTDLVTCLMPYVKKHRKLSPGDHSLTVTASLMVGKEKQKYERNS